MAKNLVIVESPAKSKTITKILWSDFEVKASLWHIVELPKNWKWVDIANDFKPLYQINPDKKRTVNELKSLAKTAEKVWLATEEDSEWEAIARRADTKVW